MAETRDAKPEEEFNVTRTFDAPLDTVWAAFTHYDRLSQWWGPAGSTWLGGRLDLQPVGLFHYGMRSAEDIEMWGKWTFESITPPDSIVFRSAFADKDGNTIRGFFSNDWPLEVRNTVTLQEHQGKTTVTLRGGPVNATEAELALFASMFASMQQGFGGTFDNLAEFLRKA